jgi:hypothetical protein
VEEFMLAKSAVAIVATGIAVGLVNVTTGSAQTSDSAYCRALADRYERYVATSSGGLGQQQAPVRISQAINQCRAGNAAASTPVLERALNEANVGLPERAQAPQASKTTADPSCGREIWSTEKMMYVGVPCSSGTSDKR